MRKTLFTAAIALSLLAPVAAQSSKDIDAWLNALSGKSVPARFQALEKFDQACYDIKDQKRRAKLRQILIPWLKSETKPENRESIARTLSQYLTGMHLIENEQKNSADFESCLPFLSDQQPRVRDLFWLAFSQQASMPHLTVNLYNKVLALVDSSDRDLKLRAMSWANQTAGQFGPHGEKVPEEFRKKVKAIQGARTSSTDPVERNLAVFGILSDYPANPAQAKSLIKTHLRDQDERTRSLVLDFLESRSPQHPELKEFRQELILRLGEVSGPQPTFPNPEDELSIGGRRPPAEPEAYRFLRVLVRFGPLPTEAYAYLQSRGIKEVEPGLLLQLTQEEGDAAKELRAKIIEQVTPQQLLGSWLSIAKGEVTPRLTELTASLIPKCPDMLNFLGSCPSSKSAIDAALPFLRDKQQIYRLSAIFCLSKLDPNGPGGIAAAEAIERENSPIEQFGTLLLVAVDTLAKSRKFDPKHLSKLLSNNEQAILQWILDGKTSSKAAVTDFVKFNLALLARPMVSSTFQAASFPEDEIVALQLRWLSAQKGPEAQSAIPLLEEMSKSPNPQSRQAALNCIKSLKESALK